MFSSLKHVFRELCYECWAHNTFKQLWTWPLMDQEDACAWKQSFPCSFNVRRYRYRWLIWQNLIFSFTKNAACFEQYLSHKNVDVVYITISSLNSFLRCTRNVNLIVSLWHRSIFMFTNFTICLLVFLSTDLWRFVSLCLHVSCGSLKDTARAVKILFRQGLQDKKRHSLFF